MIKHTLIFVFLYLRHLLLKQNLLSLQETFFLEVFLRMFPDIPVLYQLLQETFLISLTVDLLPLVTMTKQPLTQWDWDGL